MTKKLEIAILLGLGLNLLACSKAVPPKCGPETAQTAVNATPVNPQPAAEAPASEPMPTTAGNGRGVKTEMRNVSFHLLGKAVARLETLSGEIWPIGKHAMPNFDDKTSFEVHVTNGRVWVTPDAISSILNDHVFAAKDAPLKDLSVFIDNGVLVIKGKLHTKGDISFETKGTLTANGDGRLRVHTEKVKALHVPVKGVMGVLGIELASVLNTSKIDGLEIEKDDLLMDLGQLLPPPHIRGKITGVKVERETIVTLFGDGGEPAPESREKGNYMAFHGNPVRFGKLVMENADVVVLDLDPSDALDWNQDHYKEQLAAGYSKFTPALGIRAYVKDDAKLSRTQTAGTSPVPAN